MTTFDIFYLLITPIYVYNLWSYFQVRFGSNSESLGKNLFVCFISYLLISSVYLFFETPLLTVSINIMCIILISRLYISEIFKQISESIILLALFIIIELIVVTLLNIYTIDFQDTSSYQSIMSVVFTYLVEFLFIKYLHRRKYRALHKNKNIFLYTIQFIIPLITIIIFLLFLWINLSGTILMSLALFFLLINIILFELYDALAKSFDLLSEQQNFKQEQLEYASHLRLLESHNEEWRQFRHDIKNRLTPLYGFIRQYPNSELESILIDIVPDNLQKPVIETGHIAIDGIINSKLHSVSDNEIEVITDIVVPKDIYIDSIDLAVLLGNLLDNAIEGCLTVEANRIIKLKILFEGNRLKVRIANTFDGIVNKQGQQILSRKDDTSIHGFGLKSVQRIVEKYQGLLKIDHTQETFTVSIILNETPSENVDKEVKDD
ncbi:MAG TPA: hypothetical protein DEO37_06280 [Aerococcaceae bacterium]|nr:hypothetical protein [Aerococcaceae bacterium]